jgi:predicted Ser/Thr protein kinase
MADATIRIDPLPDPDEEVELVRSVLAVDYDDLVELGRGGMAVVYRARERALERDVAIKVLPLARTFDAELVTRFQREARLSASLEHPHIVPVYRVGQSGRVNFFVMKYMQGPSLSDLITASGKLEVGEVERILLEVSDALDHAHEHGVVHRDVKPDNIMKDQTGRYVMMDFGIAKSITGTQLTQTGGSIGTPKYMSPEQARGAELDGRSDFYSLGVVGYHCLIGSPPFDGEDPLAVLYSHLHDPVPVPALESADARRLYAVIARMLAKDPSERIGGGAELRAALAGAPTLPSTASMSRAATPRSLESTARAALPWLRSRTRRFWISASGLTAAVVVIFGRDGPAARCREAMPDASENDRAVLLEPLGAVRRGAEIELAYVVCGVPDDEPFTTQIRISRADGGGVVGRVGRLFGGGSDAFRESWDDGADGWATRRERTIAPGALDPGPYRLTLEIEDGRGRDADASHDFTIVEP